MPFQFQEKSRKRPKPGDVFAFHMDDGTYVMGRVLLTDAAISPTSGKANLIYIYATILDAPDTQIPMGLDDLLCNPFITNNQMWLKGFAKTVGNRPVLAEERFVKHTFYNGLSVRDEYGERTEGDPERAFGGGLWGYGVVERVIDGALAKLR